VEDALIHLPKILSAVLLLSLSLAFNVSSGLCVEGQGPHLSRTKLPASVDLKLNIGQRGDRVDWNIAGHFDGTDPNVLSELTWDRLDIYQLQISTDLLFDAGGRNRYQYLLRGMLGLGEIVDGKNRDSDYAGDNRTLEFSRSTNAADAGDVLDLSGGAGLRFSSQGRRWLLSPMFGFSYHEQNLRMVGGYQAISEQSIADDFFDPDRLLPPVGPFQERLNSSYKAKWWGPWIGLEAAFEPTEIWALRGSFAYHFAEYQGKANWNLRQDLAHPVSFRHWADGYGLVYGLELTRKLKKGWFCSLSTRYQQWQTDAGIDNTYLDGGAISATRLNEVNWTSSALMLGLVRRF
jgi:hypothetical protein